MALRKAFSSLIFGASRAFPDAAARPAHVYLVIKNLCPVTAFVTLPGYVVGQGCEDSTLGVMPEVKIPPGRVERKLSYS